MKKMKAKTTPPRNLGVPILGETIAFLREKNFSQKRHETYGSIFKTRLLGKQTVIIKGAAANQFILTNENKKEGVKLEMMR